MGSYTAFSRATGRDYPFTIDGDTPTQTEMARINQILAQEEGLSTAAVEKDDGNLFTKNIGRGIDTIQQAYGSAVEGIGESTGLDFLKNYGASVVENNRKELEASQDAARQLDDIKDVGSFFDYAGATLGSQVPQLGSTLGGSAAGAVIGSAVPIIGTAVGAVVGGLAANLPFFYGSNREAQKEEVLAGNRIEVSEGAAALAAIPQAALDLIADRFLVGGFTGKLIGGGGLFTKGIKSGIKEIGKRGAVGAGKGIVMEVPTEIGQQVLERLQAGKSLTSKEAMDEYKEVAAAAALIGGTVSSTGTIVAGSKDKKLTKDEELNRDQALEGQQTAQNIKNAENFLNKKGLPVPRTAPTEVQDDPNAAELQTEDQKAVDKTKISAAELPFFTKYSKALDAVKKSGKVNPVIVRNAVKEEGKKVPKAEVDSLIEQMVKEGEIKTIGKNKYEVLKDDLDTYKTRANALKQKAESLLEQNKAIDEETSKIPPIPSVDADPIVAETNRQRKVQLAKQYDQVVREAISLESEAGRYINKKYGTTDVKGAKDQRVSIENPVKASSIIPDFNAKKSFDVADKKQNTPEYLGKRDTIIKNLSNRLKAIGLGDVVLRQENILTAGPQQTPQEALEAGQLIEGYMQTEENKPTIALAMEIYDPNLTDAELETKIGAVLNHEVIHALKRMGLFSADELKILTDVVSKRKYVVEENGKFVNRQYTYLDRAIKMNPDLTAEAQIEEAQAEMYRDYVSGKLKVVAKPKTLFDKITKFIKSIFGAHEDAGFTDVDQIFENIGTTDEAKQIGRRARDPQKVMENQDNRMNSVTSLSDQLTGDPKPVVKPSARIPNKVKKAFKLFVQRPDGQLLPLFVNAANPIPVGQFIEADFPSATFQGRSSAKGNVSFYVPTKGADRTQGEVRRKTGTQIIINSEQDRAKLIQEGYITEGAGRTQDAPFGKVTAVAARPGFHASVMPYALHLGPQDLQVTKRESDILSGMGIKVMPKQGKYFVKRRAEDQVFAEVSMADDVDYQTQIDASDRTDINDRVPVGGSYQYRDGQANEDWVVGGDMRIDRVLSRSEAKDIQNQMGVKDLPYKAEVEEILNRKLSSELPVDTKFSVKKAITDEMATEDLLIVTHNIKPEALVRADKLGGIPMPSIAITKASLGFEGFGDISLIGNARMAEPSSTDQVFKRDAYTTRAPRPEIEATDNAIKYVEKLREDLKNDIIELYDLNPDQTDVKNTFENVFGGINFDALENDVIKLNQDYDSFRLDEIYLDEMSPVLRLKYLKDTGAMTDFIKQRVYGDKENRDRLTGDILNEMAGFGFADYSDQINVYYQGLGEKKLKDWLLTERENALESVNETYANKRMPLVLERVADFETGERKKATLDNIVKIMRKKRGPAQEKGFELATTLGPLAARVTPRFKTLQEIKNSRGRIDYKEFDKAKGEVSRAINLSEEALYEFLRNNSTLQQIVEGNADGYTVDDVININGIPNKMLANILEKKSDLRYQIRQVITDERKTEFIKELERIQTTGIPQPLLDLINETGRRIKAMPTEYFEIKPLRGVRLNEFVGALIPEETSAQVRQILKRNMPDGKIVEYGENRTEKLMEFKDVMFSRKQLPQELLNQSVIGKYKTDPNTGMILTKEQLGDENPFITSAAKGTVKLEDALQKLQDDRGGAVYDINNPEDREKVSQIIAEEALVAMERDSSAVGWYDRTLKLAKKVMGVAHPEIDKNNPAYNADNEAVFDFALAITSNGLAIIPNFKLATQQYENWVETGTFKEEGKDAGVVKAFTAYNMMKETMSDTQITEFLNSDFTFGELRNLPLIKELGITISATESVNTIVKGSQIFGSKIGGAFYQNVRGNYDALTMDRWFMRNFNRITGNPFKIIGENVLTKNNKRLLDAVDEVYESKNNYLINLVENAKDEANVDIISEANVGDIATAVDRQYQVYFNNLPKELREDKPELNLAAQSLNRNQNVQVVDAPRSGGDRFLMRLTMNRAREILAGNGIFITNADVQALLWYAEKDLLEAYGVRKGQGLKNDYVDGAIAVLRERGIENEKISETLPDAERIRLDSDTNTETKIAGVYNPNDVVTQEEADGDIDQEVEEYDVAEGISEEEKTAQDLLNEDIDKFNTRFSTQVNPNKVIFVPLADPSTNIFGNKYAYGRVKGPRGTTVEVILTEGFHEYKGTDVQGNPIYSGEGMAHILGERGRKPNRRDELLTPTAEGNWIKYKDVETAIYEMLKAYKYNNGVREAFDGKSPDKVIVWDKAKIAGKNNKEKTLALVLKYKPDTYNKPVYVVNTTFLEASDRRLNLQRSNSVAPMPTTDTTPDSDQIVQDVENKRLNIQYNNLSKILGKIVSKVTFGKIEKEKAQKEAEKILIKFQDAMLPVGDMLDELKKKGFTVADALDTYMQEELFHGRAGARVEKVQKELFEPMSETIKTINISDAEYNSLSQISNFFKLAREKYIDKRLAVADAILYARHAKERNRYINQNKSEGKNQGSGMADTEADAIINWLSTLNTAEQGKIARIENLAKDIVTNTNQQRLESGLIKPELLDQNFKSQVYDNYVPLRGDLDYESEAINKDSEDLMGKPRMTTNLFGASGKEDRSATGQALYAENIIASLMAQNQRSIDRGERNKVGRSFVDLLRGQEEQADGSFAINDALATEMSKIAEIVTDTSNLRPENILTIKENGVEVKVNFKDLRIGRAMKGHLSPESVGKFTKALGKMNRYLSSINTTYNPSFVIPNFARDLQAAGVNMQQYDQKGMTKEVLTSALPAVKGIAAVLRGGKETFWSAEYNKFVENGGKNATNQMGDLQDQINNIGSILGDISDSGIKGKLGLNKNGFTRRLLNFLDDYNTAVENGVRVATFTSLVKRGVSPARAAQAARNVTVNFAKGGENKTLMNSWYLFYNASLQGSMALINAAAKSSKVRKVWAGLVIYGIMQDQINSLLSGDEDEDGISDYDELPRYVLEHNLILPTFGLAGDKFIQIPLSYGLNLATNFGRALSRTARGEYTSGEASRTIFGTAFESISPFGGFDNIYNLTAPTVLDPFVSLAINEDYKGDPIFKESPTFASRPTPDSQAYWSNTSSISKGIAGSINSITGGDAVESGYIDFSPNTLEFWFDYFAGGTGAFAQRSLEAPFNIIDALKGDFEGDIMRAVPLVRKVIISPSEREDVGNYLENRQDLFTVLARIDLAKKSGDGEAVRGLFTRYKDQLRIAGRIKAIDNARNRLLRQIKEIERNPRIPEETKLNLKRIRREKINDLMRQGLILMRTAGFKKAG